MKIFTIGHSNRSFDDFVEILKNYDISTLIDIRSIPKSRAMPQYNQEFLVKELPKNHIEYIYLHELGGRRYAKKDSINTAWRNKSFRGYADYMQTNEFKSGIDRLISLANDKTIAIMCAEAVPWRCHRSLVGDALMIRGIEVYDIFDNKNCRKEKITDFAKVNNHAITYPE